MVLKTLALLELENSQAVINSLGNKEFLKNTISKMESAVHKIITGIYKLGFKESFKSILLAANK